MWKPTIRICMGKKTYHFRHPQKWKDFNKNSLPFIKCVLRLSCVVHGPIHGRFMGCTVNGFLLYCWFSVSGHSKLIKIKIKTVEQIKSRIWEMKGGKYAKTLAKIQVRGIFRIRDIRRNVLPKFIEICMETPCWCSSWWAPTWRTETNRNICYRALLQKCEFIFWRTHKR